MDFLDVLIHGASIGENPVAKHTRKLFAVMQRFSMSFQVGLPTESLSALGTWMNFLLNEIISLICQEIPSWLTMLDRAVEEELFKLESCISYAIKC